ncbi:MAG: HEAT repeat domain-containing protein [Nitrospirota bacterium]
MRIENLAKLLKSNDVEIRRGALESIRGKPNDRYINILLSGMKDISWRIRHTAIDILLEDYPVEKYVGGLIQLLYCEDNAGARNSAIEALVRLNKRVTTSLIEAFNTPNKDVRKFIIDILGEFKDSRSLPLMLDALKDEDENVRATAIEHLGKVGESSVVDSLIEVLKGGDLWSAYPAADALGRIGDRKAIPALIKALDKKTLREPAIKALSYIGDPKTLKYIVPFIGDSSKTIQEEALRSIERFYHKGVSEDFITDEIKSLIGDKVLDILVAHAWSQKPDVRVVAILILGMMKDERAYTPLLEISQEENLREDVMRAFVFIGKDSPESLLRLFETESFSQKRFLCEVADKIAAPVYYDILEKLLEHEDGHIRSLAALAISKLGNLKAIEPVKKLLADSYEDVQEFAVEALYNLRDGLSTTELLGMLDNPNPAIRKNAALLLGKIRAKEAVPALGFALKDGNISVRKAVVIAFSNIKTEESIKFLILALTDEKPDIRVMSALSLGRIGGNGVFEALSILLADSDDSVRGAAARSIGMLKDKRAIKPLIGLLSDKNGFVVATAMESLSMIGGSDARSALIHKLSSKDKEIIRTAIKSLSSFDGIEEKIIPFLRDEDWATRMAAIEVLAKRKSKRNIKNELEKLLDIEEDPVVKKAVEESIGIRK